MANRKKISGITMNHTGWQVKEYVFDNKWDAVRYCSMRPNFYQAYCNDDTWNDADWTVEPTESIEQLQKNHAEYLREKYKTLVLFYSAGSDSQVLLETFIEHKIPLDYIYVQYVDVPDRNFNKDVHLALKYLEENKSKLMGAEIFYEKYLDHQEGNSIYNFNGNLRDTNFQLRFHHCGNCQSLQLRQPKVYEKVEDNGCIVTGGDKPYIIKDEKGFYMQQLDVTDENWGQPHHEMFWMGKDPSLQIKQCHLAKQWLEEHNLTETISIYSDKNSRDFFDLNRRFGRTFLDEHFNTKLCFGSMLEDKYFPQWYGVDWCNSHWVGHFSQWRDSDSYNSLKNELEKIDSKFVENYKLVGWSTAKRYLD